MLTAQNILDTTKKTHPQVWKNKRTVTFLPTSVKEWRDTKGRKVKTVKGRARDSGGSGRPHNLEIDYYGRGKNAQVWVTCDCEYFQYNCEVALFDEDSSNIRWSNGEGYQEHGPNPDAAPRACKHLAYVLDLPGDKYPTKYRSKKIVDRDV